MRFSARLWYFASTKASCLQHDAHFWFVLFCLRVLLLVLISYAAFQDVQSVVGDDGEHGCLCLNFSDR